MHISRRPHRPTAADPARPRTATDLAILTASVRAYATARPRSPVHDPYAQRLTGDRGAEMIKQLPMARLPTALITWRTATFDEFILHLVRTGRIDAVVNLGAGLDTRPWRLPLPDTMHWTDVDLPSILTHKQQALDDVAPRCHYAAVPLDLTRQRERQHLLDDLAAAHLRTLIVSEGLLYYLDPAQVRTLATDLAGRPAFRYWLTDLMSPLAARMMRRAAHRALLRSSGTALHFAPHGGAAYFAPFGWHTAASRATITDATRLLGRQPRPPASTSTRPQRTRSGTVLLTRATAPAVTIRQPPTQP
jgi:methyltransferase (TIGR00027 family)